MISKSISHITRQPAHSCYIIQLVRMNVRIFNDFVVFLFCVDMSRTNHVLDFAAALSIFHFEQFYCFAFKRILIHLHDYDLIYFSAKTISNFKFLLIFQRFSFPFCLPTKTTAEKTNKNFLVFCVDLFADAKLKSK